MKLHAIATGPLIDYDSLYRLENGTVIQIEGDDRTKYLKASHEAFVDLDTGKVWNLGFYTIPKDSLYRVVQQAEIISLK